MLDKILSAWVIVLLVMSLMLMNNYILNNVVFKHTHKTNLYIDWLMQMLWPEAWRNLALFSCRSNGSVFINSVFPVTLQNINTTNNENRLYIIPPLLLVIICLLKPCKMNYCIFVKGSSSLYGPYKNSILMRDYIT